MANEELKAKVELWSKALRDHNIRAIAMGLQQYNSDATSTGLTVSPEIREAMEAVCHHAGNRWTPASTSLQFLKEDLAQQGDVSEQFAKTVAALDGFADAMREPLAKLAEVMPKFSGDELERNKKAETSLKAAVAEAREAAKELKKTPPEPVVGR